MENKFGKAVLAGFIATIVMTMVMFLAPMMGLPKMNIPQTLAGMLGVSVVIGWIMHFMIGLIFAFVYVYWFNPSVHIHSKAGKGLLYGVVVLIFAMIMMFLMTRVMPVPEGMMGNMGLTMLGALIGHLVYGLFVGLVVPLKVSSAHGLKHNFQTS